MNQFFTSGGQSIGASASVLPMNIQDWFPLGLTGLISLQSKDSQESSLTPQCKSVNLSVLSFLYSPNLTSIHDHWKTIALPRQTFVSKIMSLLFNMLFRLFITSLPRSNHFLISWLQLLSEVILQPKKIKSVTISIVSPSISHEVMGLDAMILVFWMLSLSQLFHSPLSLSSRGSLVLHFLP